MKTTKKNLALLELILAILFFALSAAVLTQVFVKAKTMSDSSRAGTLGLVAAEDLAERLKAAPWDAGKILSAEAGWTPEQPDGEGGFAYTAGYGGDMRPTAGEADYLVRVAVSPEARAAGTLYRISVGIERMFDHENILELKTGRYVAADGEVMP